MAEKHQDHLDINFIDHVFQTKRKILKVILVYPIVKSLANLRHIILYYFKNMLLSLAIPTFRSN